ncbi:MAG: class I SAM-dependent methyltransferase [Rhabdaerophilum sp.]
MKNHFGTAFYSTQDYPKFFNAIQTAINSITNPAGIYTGDNLFTYHRNLSFLDDRKFMESHGAHATTDAEYSILWRMAVVLWGFRNGLRLQGDFVECACYRGITARVICDTVEFKKFPDRHYYLYDLFDHDPDLPHHAMPQHSKELFAEVKQRFAEYPNVTVTQGKVPDVLASVSPKKIAFMHLDLNNVDAEIGALEVLFDRIVPGGVIVLDDYGWLGYRPQRLAEEPWFAARGCHVLELPTGQGLVIKN